MTTPQLVSSLRFVALFAMTVAGLRLCYGVHPCHVLLAEYIASNCSLGKAL